MSDDTMQEAQGSSPQTPDARAEREDTEHTEDTEGSLRKKTTDESWKKKAQEEKEKLARKAEESKELEYPPASFLGLVEELSLRALLALGRVRNPATGQTHFDLAAAKYAIDLLEVLEEKTRDRLDEQEKAGLTEALYSLRLVFVQASRNPPKTAGDSGIAAASASSLPQEGSNPGAEKPGPKIIL